MIYKRKIIERIEMEYTVVVINLTLKSTSPQRKIPHIGASMSNTFSPLWFLIAKVGYQFELSCSTLPIWFPRGADTFIDSEPEQHAEGRSMCITWLP